MWLQTAKEVRAWISGACQMCLLGQQQVQTWSSLRAWAELCTQICAPNSGQPSAADDLCTVMTFIVADAALLLACLVSDVLTDLLHPAALVSSRMRIIFANDVCVDLPFATTLNDFAYAYHSWTVRSQAQQHVYTVFPLSFHALQQASKRCIFPDS